MKEHKILITGTTGAGKTTAIAAISEVPPISTDVVSRDQSIDKEKTTVAFDYGVFSLGDDECVRIYGTPGQKRFSFMWKILAKGALGVIILVDNTRPDPLADVDIYLENFESLIKERACVICLTKVNEDDKESINKLSSYISEKGIICPIVSADIRRKEDVVLLLDLLLTQLYI